VKGNLEMGNDLKCGLKGRRIRVTQYCRKEIFTEFDCTERVEEGGRMRHRLRIARAYDENGNLSHSATTYRLGSREGLWMRWGVKNVDPSAGLRIESLEDASSSNVSETERVRFATHWKWFTGRLATAYTFQVDQYQKEKADGDIREIKELFGPGAVTLLAGEPAVDQHQQCDDLLVFK
jgi:hypothetical protein